MKIQEMTMRGPNYDKSYRKIVNKNKSQWQHSEHIADIDDLKVKRLDNIYSIWNNDIIAFFELNNNIIQNIWINEEYRNQKLFSKILWFLKTRENINPILIGDIHSPQMQEVVKGLSKFKKSWYDPSSNSTEDFNNDTLDKYYSYSAPTKWMLMLENNGDFDNWPRYNSNSDWMRQDYEWQIK